MPTAIEAPLINVVNPFDRRRFRSRSAHAQEAVAFTPTFYGPQRPLYRLIIADARKQLTAFCESKEGVTAKQFQDKLAYIQSYVDENCPQDRTVHFVGVGSEQKGLERNDGWGPRWVRAYDVGETARRMLSEEHPYTIGVYRPAPPDRIRFFRNTDGPHDTETVLTIPDAIRLPLHRLRAVRDETLDEGLLDKIISKCNKETRRFGFVFGALSAEDVTEFTSRDSGIVEIHPQSRDHVKFDSLFDPPLEAEDAPGRNVAAEPKPKKG